MESETLKLITLNIWGGRVYAPLMEFLSSYSRTVDIFCFQEVFNYATTERSIHDDSVMDIYAKIAEVLAHHNGYFAPAQDNEEGLAIFASRDLTIERQDDVFVHRWRNAMENNDAKLLGRNLEYVQLAKGSQRFTVANMHGLWNGQGKTDTPDRIEQSRKARKFIKWAKSNGPVIHCGDFNLLRNTTSLKILEMGMRNLVTEYGVTSTRSEFYAKPDKDADYILVSPEVEVRHFQVLPDIVSDHLPLYLEFA